MELASWKSKTIKLVIDAEKSFAYPIEVIDIIFEKGEYTILPGDSQKIVKL